MTEQTEYATGGYVAGPKPGDPPLTPDFDRCGLGRYVDHGIRIPRGDVHIVLLDAAPVPDHIKYALDAIGNLFGQHEKQPTEENR